jgi:hypothetical protein
MKTLNHRLLVVLSALLLTVLLLSVSCQAKAKTTPSSGSVSTAPAPRRVEVVFAQGQVSADGTTVDIGALLGQKVRIETGTGSTYICACNGRVHTVDAAGGNAIELAAAHHVARVYTAKDGRVMVTGAPPSRRWKRAIGSLAHRLYDRLDEA